jgi:hypothetical protein
MTISDEDFHKMFDLVRELHENYTKAIERENETLRNMLAETQKQLDEAVATLEKINKSQANKPPKEYEEILKKFKEMQDNSPLTHPTISPGYGPWVAPNSYPPVQWTTGGTGTLPPLCGGMTSTAANGYNQHNYASTSDKIRELYAKAYAKADEDG